MIANTINNAINRAGNNPIRRAALMEKLMRELDWRLTDEDIEAIAKSIHEECDGLEAGDFNQVVTAAGRVA